MKNLHLVLVLFSIASMFTSFGVYDVDATKYESNGKAKGCDNDNEKVKEKNPNCDNGGSDPPTCVGPTGDCDGDGLSDAFEDGVPCLDKTMADTDGDGWSDGEEWGKTDPCEALSHP